jgi:hypothetical protein
VEVRGRSCPIGYRYQPEVLAQAARLEADTLYVVGGLYGNLVALRAVLERADREPGGPAAVVFNGDFHWLDVDPDDFRAVSQAVLARHATKGNVEAELGSEDDGGCGCGCAYPDYVGDEVVERSNQIITRLRATAGRSPELVRRMGELPRYLTASVAGERAGIIHGDPESLAGWRLALEAMEPGAGSRPRLPSCWTGFVAPTLASSPAPTPDSRMPRSSPTDEGSAWWSTTAPPAWATSPAPAMG